MKKYEREGKARETIKAPELWFEFRIADCETGNTYMFAQSMLP